MTALDRAELIAEVARLTAERDQARDIAVVLEQQTAEALRIAREALDGVGDSNALARFEDALEDVVRLLGDDETETGQ